jgi:serine/threonine protein kinase
MDAQRFTVLGPLMGGKGSRAFLGVVQDDKAVGARRGQQRPVVMVFMPDGIVNDPDLLQHVEEETKVASEIDHINVIGVWGVAKLPEGTARVVEFADAESLATVYERLKEVDRTLPANLAAAIVKDACMGAHYAHELGRMETGAAMIHGGLRPQTLLVSFQGMSKVTGYGAAVLAEWVRKERGEEAIVRDPYTAPEQIFGGRTAATEQTDVYSLGALLFEALTGRPPIDESAGIGDVLIRDDMTHEQLVGVDPRLADIVVRAMKRKATDRYPSALDMRMALLETNLCASDQDVRSFMEELFPPDYPTRVARMNLLASARKKREVTRPQQPAPPVPSVAEAKRIVDAAAIEAAERGPRPVASEQELPAEMSLADAGAASSEVTDPYRYSPAALAPGASAPGVPAQPAASTPAVPAPPAAPPPVVQPAVAAPPPQVVYKTPAWIPIAFAVVVGAAVALGAVLYFQSQNQPVVAQLPPPPPPPPVDQQPQQDQTPPPANDASPPPANPTSSTPTPAPDPKPRPKPRPTTGTIVVSSVPPVALYIDGKKVGVGKGSLEVKAGTHRVKAKDSSKGINTSRKVRVRGGETQRVAFEIGKGKLLLSAPTGALVYLDGRKIGVAPLNPYTVYEGSHVLTVKREIGGPEYKRKFSVRPGDEVSMWVEFRAQ